MSNKPPLETQQETPTKIRPALLIVAAGAGSRMGADVPKQYLKLGGLSLLRRSIESWSYPYPLLIQVVVSQNAQDQYKQAIDGTAVALLPHVFGGTDRQSSVTNGLEALVEHNPTHVLIHDAARPCMPSFIYDQVLEAAIKDGCAVPVLPQIDSLHEVEEGFIKQTVDRSRFVRAQTPQGFEFQAIWQAHKAFFAQSFTDDVALAIAAGMKVKLVDGHEDGMKVTTQNDLTLLNTALLAKQWEF